MNLTEQITDALNRIKFEEHVETDHHQEIPQGPADDLQTIAAQTVSQHQAAHRREMLLIDEIDATLTAADDEMTAHLKAVMDRHARNRGAVHSLAVELCQRMGRLPKLTNQPVTSARMPKIIRDTIAD